MDEAVSARRQAKIDIVTGCVLLAVAAIASWSLAANDILWAMNFGRDPGPAFMPILLIVLLVLCVLGLLIKSAVTLARTAEAVAAAEAPAGVGWDFAVYPALLVASLIAHALLMRQFGFIATTTAFSVLWTVLLGIQDFGRLSVRSAALYFVEAIAITAGIYITFAEIINVPLP